MSREHDEAADNSRKKTKRGSVKNAKRLSAFGKASGTDDASWGNCDAQLLQSVIDKITSLGGAITVSLSRDLGAHSLTLMLDGDRETLWFNGSADLDDELLSIQGKLDSMS